ncbi:hypothetical protein ACORG1_13070 [Mycobacterium sp. TJFP1]
MVLPTWRKFPTEIRYDLSAVHHRCIGEWHRGEMSSNELIDLVEHLDDRSAFKTALRGGDWCMDQYVAARTANEIALSRADGRDYEPELVYSPAQKNAQNEREKFRRERHYKAREEMTRKQRKAVSASGN